MPMTASEAATAHHLNSETLNCCGGIAFLLIDCYGMTRQNAGAFDDSLASPSFSSVLLETGLSMLWMGWDVLLTKSPASSCTGSVRSLLMPFTGFLFMVFLA